jgi:hypothetical protein
MTRDQRTGTTMRRLGFILLILLLCAAVFVTRRHRQRVMTPVQPDPATIDDSPTDVAATLRVLGDSQSDDANKGWATRFVDFVNDHPGGEWIVGKCDRPCLSEAEAANSARTDAARRLYPLMVRRLGPTRSETALLRKLVWNDIQNARLESDRFAEQFSRPYGKVWTESVLLDVSPARIDPLVEQYRHQIDARHLQLRRHAGIGGFVIAATAMLYLLLNSVTKGYFTFRLRLAAMFIVAAVLILIV